MSQDFGKTSSRMPIEVLYVVGSGHTGSTLMNIVLGQHPEITSHGELVYLARDGWVSNKRCSCGTPANDCPFWSEVRRRWLERVGADGVEVYVGLQDDFERHRSWPRLLLQRYKPSKRFRAYSEHTRALFKTLQEVSGRPIVVDSSKEPPRAFALTMIPGLDLRLMHLMRDGRGVARSHDKKGNSIWRTALFWIVANLASEQLLRRLGPGKSVRVRYEDLVADPGEELNRIGAVVGVDLTRVAAALSNGDDFKVGHTIAGNRLRHSKSVRLRPDEGSWRDNLSIKKQRLFWALTGWLARRYGYKR